ncbi:unnamed protein product [Gongylonema pulchrum]|uniref:Uncharacterized protein n=1 Tax=Gongylonema pulchrum TaxID=637853 RepID=A0A3P7RFI9_9BILA|nr:unnamed protein product [Gongylonema pulchrum]
MLASCSSLTVQEELQRLCADLLYVRVARRLRIHKVMLPDSADTLANMTLAALALGRGAAVHCSTGTVNRGIGSVTVIRPLREISEKELALVNHFEKSDRFILNEQKSLLDNVRCDPSVETVTRNFINGLISDGFTGSVPSILSTVSKLQSAAANSRRCSLCLLMFAPEREERFVSLIFPKNCVNLIFFIVRLVAGTFLPSVLFQ